jgi:hypothetical protein
MMTRSPTFLPKVPLLIQDELSDLASKALFPSVLHDEPKIYPSQSPTEQKNDLEHQANPVIHNFHKNQGEDQGDVLICGLWAHITDCIIDIRITDVDAKSNLSKDPDKGLMTTHEWEKKKKYL